MYSINQDINITLENGENKFFIIKNVSFLFCIFKENPVFCKEVFPVGRQRLQSIVLLFLFSALKGQTVVNFPNCKKTLLAIISY